MSLPFYFIYFILAKRSRFDCMVKESSIQNDGLLAPWLQAVRTRSDEAAESALASLIETYIAPVIKSVIRFKLRPDSADEADLAQEALAQWLAELRKLGAQPDDRSIGDARGLGLMQAIELVKDRKTKEPHPQAVNRVFEDTKKRKVLVGKGGLYGNVIRTGMMLNSTKAEVDEMVNAIDAGLTAAAGM